MSRTAKIQRGLSLYDFRHEDEFGEEDRRGHQVSNMVFYKRLPSNSDAITFYRCVGFGVTEPMLGALNTDGKNLRNVILDLESVRFDDLNLEGFDWFNVDFTNRVLFEHSNLSNGKLVSFSGSVDLDSCDLSRTKLIDSERMVLWYCDLTGAQIENCSDLAIYDSKLHQATLVNLQHVRLHDCEIVNATLGIDLSSNLTIKRCQIKSTYIGIHESTDTRKKYFAQYPRNLRDIGLFFEAGDIFLSLENCIIHLPLELLKFSGKIVLRGSTLHACSYFPYVRDGENMGDTEIDFEGVDISDRLVTNDITLKGKENIVYLGSSENIQGLDLSHTYILGTDSVEFDEVQASDVDFSDSCFPRYTQCRGASLQNAKFGGVSFGQGNFGFESSYFDPEYSVDFEGSDLSNVSFEATRFLGGDLNFGGCALNNTSFEGAIFPDSHVYVNFNSADLSNVNLGDEFSPNGHVSFLGSKFENHILKSIPTRYSYGKTKTLYIFDVASLSAELLDVLGVYVKGVRPKVHELFEKTQRIRGGRDTLSSSVMSSFYSYISDTSSSNDPYEWERETLKAIDDTLYMHKLLESATVLFIGKATSILDLRGLFKNEKQHLELPPRFDWSEAELFVVSFTTRLESVNFEASVFVDTQLHGHVSRNPYPSKNLARDEVFDCNFSRCKSHGLSFHGYKRLNQCNFQEFFGDLEFVDVGGVTDCKFVSAVLALEFEDSGNLSPSFEAFENCDFRGSQIYRISHDSSKPIYFKNCDFRGAAIPKSVDSHLAVFVDCVYDSESEFDGLTASQIDSMTRK